MPDFVRSHGLGNDYVVVDPARLPFSLTPAVIRLLCDRHFGIGSDGLLAVDPDTRGADFGVRIYNPDGSEAEKSGNGIRIFAKYLREHGRTDRDRFTIRTLGGVVRVALVLTGGAVTEVIADLGRASFSPPDALDVDGTRLAVTTVSLGNPHCVVLVPDLAAIDVHALGPKIERHPAFASGTNVQFARVLARDTIEIRIWERGAGYTLASGTSSCAAVAACVRLGLVDDDVSVVMPGGRLHVSIDADGELRLRGAVEEIALGDLSPDLLRRIASAA